MIEITNHSRRPRAGSAAAQAASERTGEARSGSLRMTAGIGPGSAARAAEAADAAARQVDDFEHAARPATRMNGSAGFSLRAAGGRVVRHDAAPAPAMQDSLHQGALPIEDNDKSAAKIASAVPQAPAQNGKTPGLLARAVNWLMPLVHTFRGTDVPTQTASEASVSQDKAVRPVGDASGPRSSQNLPRFQ